MFQSIFGFISGPMEVGLVYLTLAVGSAGIAIILFTILVRLVLAPLQIVQLRNAKAMQRLQPLMAEVRAKHKDREAQSRALMELYKEHNVNPAMGCLPTLLQFPILIGLFYALMHLGSSPAGYPAAIVWSKVTCNGHAISGWSQWFSTCYAVKGAPGNVQHIFNLFHADFLWLSHGLGKPDPFYILPILAGVTQWVQSRMMLTKTQDPQQQMMNNLMNFMPLMIVVFAANYPSGLSLYWVTSTLIGILIQYRITGWGLLKNPFGEAGLPSLSRLLAPPQAGGSSSRPRRPTQPRQTLAPVPEVEPDGNGDSPDKPPGAAATRPRKKANRAKGGRGGRRG